MTKLNNVCEFQSGLWKGKKGPFAKANVIRNTNFRPNGNLSYENIALLDVESKELVQRELQHGDIILEKSGGGAKTPVGRVCLFEKQNSKIPYSLSNFTSLLRVKDSSILNYKYLHKFLYFFYISGKTEPMQRNSTGIRNLQLKEYKDISMPLPPLAEQQRIVAKLDASFAEIDKIKKLDEIKLKSNNFLIQSYLDNVFEINENLYKLSDCVEINPAKKEVNDLDDATEVSFMPMKDMGINNKLAIPNQKRKLKDVKGSYTYFSEGDILLAKITPCFENGKMGIASNLLNGIGFGSSEYIVFRPNKNLKNDWLYYFLNRNSFRIDGSRNMSGAVGHKRVNKEFIGNTLIPIPSIEEQEKILFTLTNLSNHSKAINKIILKKNDEINYLKKSILNRLLSNKLVDAA